MSTFRFKHFTIQQEQTALKVGTDAMLLGSLCHWNSPTRLLDIGTGTGVLALMCAQRFGFNQIVGLEIDESAAKEAQLNTTNSPFTSPIQIIHKSLQDFHSEEQFDAIISNPPYFENSSKNEDKQLGLARHTDSLSYEELIANVARLLSKEGQAWIILPHSSEESIERLAEQHHLFIHQLIRLEGKPGKQVRTVFCFGHRAVVEVPETIFSTFIIRNENGDYSEEYKELTKEFHDREL